MLPDWAKKIPPDDDTRILRRKTVDVGGKVAVDEAWTWEGVRGRSIVLLAVDFDGVGDAHLIQLVRQYAGSDGEITLCRESGFIFVNYGFR